MEKDKTNDTMNRYHQVIAERNIYFDNRECKQWKQLSEIAKLTLNELTIGEHPRHVMYMQGTDYFYRCE